MRRGSSATLVDGMIRGRCRYAGRTYVVDSVCMKIYDAENRLIQMVSLMQARVMYADILRRMAAGEAGDVGIDLSGLTIEEKDKVG